jgi:Carboxypeptidase regulatory-like domain
MKYLLSAAFVAFLIQTAIAQTSNGVPIQGIVTQSGSDEVVWGASVELRKEGGTTALYGALTGVDGKFAFPSVAAGRYQLVATSSGYVPAEYGQKRMKGAGLPLVVTAGQAMSILRMEMVPTGAISGRVTDPYGQPLAIADVFVLRSSYQEGRRILTQVLSAKTDERGEFRLFWLTPGTYYLNVVVPDGTNQADLIMNADNINPGTSIIGVRNILRDVLSRPIGNGAAENESHVPVYYPSTTNPQQARPIEVRPGEDIRGIYITAGVVRTFHVRGVVSNFVAGAGMQGQTRLIPTDPAWPPTQTPLDSNTGKFDYSRVVPGSYILYVQVRPPGATSPADALWATMPLEVREQDVDNLTLVPRAGVSLSGKVVVDGLSGDAPPPSVGGLFLGMRPDPLVTQQAPSPSTRVSPDGTFVLTGAIAGNYRVYAPPLLSPNNPQLLGGLPPLPAGLENSYVKSIRVGGADVLDSGVRLIPVEGLSMEIVLGTNAGALEGRVMRDGKPAADATVGMLPNTASARGYRTDMHRTILTDASGHFQIRGLPPGDYKIFAWEDADKDAIMDLDFVRGYEEKGTRIEIADGEKKSIELNVIPARMP